MICGIYAIRTNNGRIYIGQSQNIPQRMKQHLQALDAGSHPNRGLQNDLKRLGFAGLTVSVLQT
jgi:predicted GIY-YIG superfamily endonuclease